MRSFAPCPDSPNCVSTLAPAQDSRHAIGPYRYSKTRLDAKAVLKAIIGGLPRTKLIEEEDGYLHYEFTSLLLRFVDDVEFLFEEASKTIHFRSASRVGYGDFGVNRRRMEDIRSQIQGKL
ncbi:MAG TPA: DUF1499 domain-containing protein [Nitrospiraceae bacterium]|jgi:uncharacterized protein (DUF1499 family)|nr:DUF1499 domain-containing protein [Nitrospiraceae bacterium]